MSKFKVGDNVEINSEDYDIFAGTVTYDYGDGDYEVEGEDGKTYDVNEDEMTLLD